MRHRLLELAKELEDPGLADLVPELLPWQRWFLIHALELLPGPEKRFRFRTILLLVARQNGKTSLLVILILWRMFTDGASMIIGAADNLDLAEETWDRVAEVASAIPELEQEVEKISEGNGKKYIRLETRERYRPQASNGRGGRGWPGEMVLLDELRMQKTWAAWSAISKATMAKSRAQVYGVTNAGDASAIVLRHLRKMAVSFIDGETMIDTDVADDPGLAQLLEQSAIGLFEWSAKDGRGIWDRDGWYEANPSLGYTIDEASIAAAAGSDPEWVFRTEVLNQFVDTSQGGPFSAGSWEATRVPAAEIKRDRHRAAGYCVDVSYDRKMAYVALAFFDTTGRLRCEIAEQKPGTDWIIPWLQSKKRKIAPDLVTLQTNAAPVSSLIADFEAAGINLVPWAGPDLPRASGIVWDEIDRGTVTHGAQPVLDIAATTAVPKTSGDGWLIDRKNSPEDAAPLVAFTGAVWLVRVHGKSRDSVYEKRDLITL